MALCEQAGVAGRFGLDTEFVREKSYYSKLALVQIAVNDTFVLIDPLANLDLAPLDALMLDPTVLKVLHAATQDLEIFYDRTGSVPVNIFDTQVAGSIVGVGHQVGYGSLTERVLGVALKKTSQYTNWLQRPLSAAQESYALDDVRYLLPLMDALMARLTELKRVDAVQEEMQLLSRESLYSVDVAHLAKRIKGGRGLKGAQRNVLLRLTAWREDEAQHRDVPRRWVVADDSLAALARAAPVRERELSSIRGLHPREIKRSGPDILAAIKAGKADPVPEKAPPRARAAQGDLGGDFVHLLLKILCQEASIAPAAVATTAVIDELVASWHAGTLEQDGSPLLTGWRGELFGARLLGFMEGRFSVHFSPETGRPVLTERDT